MMQDTDLSQVKAGDKVYLERGYQLSLLFVTKITPTGLIKTKHHLYNPKTGILRGCNYEYLAPTIFPATEANTAVWNGMLTERKLAKYIDDICDIDVKVLSVDAQEQLLEDVQDLMEKVRVLVRASLRDENKV